MDYSSVSYNKNSDSQYQESEFLWQRTTIEHNSRKRMRLGRTHGERVGK